MSEQQQRQLTMAYTHEDVLYPISTQSDLMAVVGDVEPDAFSVHKVNGRLFVWHIEHLVDTSVRPFLIKKGWYELKKLPNHHEKDTGRMAVYLPEAL